MIICAVGVFVDISVITVAPIALAIGKKAGLSKSGVLLTMIGGGKVGRILFLREYASYIKDRMITDLSDFSRNLMLSIDILPIFF